jgi:hypothetical protein
LELTMLLIWCSNSTWVLASGGATVFPFEVILLQCMGRVSGESNLKFLWAG